MQNLAKGSNPCSAKLLFFSVTGILYHTYLRTCLSCVSELTWTSHVSQWNVLFCRPVDVTVGDSNLFFTPGLGKDLMEPFPFRASSMVLCLVPERQIQKKKKKAPICYMKHYSIKKRNKDTEKSSLDVGKVISCILGLWLFICTGVSDISSAVLLRCSC